MSPAYCAFIGTPAWNGLATVPSFAVGDLVVARYAFYMGCLI